MRNGTTPAWSSWGLDELQSRYPGLRLRPAGGGVFALRGELAFRATGNGVEVEDSFDVEILIPALFPATVPTVKEFGGRVPSNFHTHSDRTLCLGSPLRIKVELAREPTLCGYVERLIIPYLFNFVVGQRTGRLPLGELSHGNPGVIADYRRLLNATTDEQCLALFLLLTLNKRVANKLPCPCGSGLRVGRCHNTSLNWLRTVAPRSWFKRELHELSR